MLEMLLPSEISSNEGFLNSTVLVLNIIYDVKYPDLKIIGSLAMPLKQSWRNVCHCICMSGHALSTEEGRAVLSNEFTFSPT